MHEVSIIETDKYVTGEKRKKKNSKSLRKKANFGEKAKDSICL